MPKEKLKVIKVILEEGEVTTIEGIPSDVVVEIVYISDLPDSPIVETYRGQI